MVDILATKIGLHASVRMLILLPLATLISLTFFVVLSELIEEDNQAKVRNDIPNLDFLLLRSETDIELRDRSRPQPPEPIMQPDIPSVPDFEVSSETSAINDISIAEVSHVDLDMQIDMSSVLKNIGAAKASSEMFSVEMLFEANPNILRRSSPRYPTRALRKKQEGYVLLEFEVDENGEVVNDSIEVIESSPKGVFENSVLRSIKRWRFQPKKVNGNAVRYKTRQPVEFKLD